MNPSIVSVNGRSYRLPARPTAVICIDGCEPLYLEKAIADGVMPTLARFREQGFSHLATSALPSITNTNNLSIVTGVPPSVHGICGNYFYDSASGQEVLMNDPRFLRCPTIPAVLSQAGVATTVITAKDKLRRLLGHGMHGICFSAEKADQATLTANGIERVVELVGQPVPPVYSAELSEYVLAAGLALVQHDRARLLYLSLTDFIQHKHAPGSPAAIRFHAMLDRYFKAFDDAGVVLGITADHGMKAKSRSDGTPNVVYLRPILDALLGPGRSRIILPITDPYVVHHGALGSFATIYVDDPAGTAAVMHRLAIEPGIAAVHDRATACRRFELPPDRMGDIVVLADAPTVLGKSAEDHDLTLLEEPLRSHGGMEEQTVPFIVNRPVRPDYADRAQALRNFDIFDWVLNGTE